MVQLNNINNKFIEKKINSRSVVVFGAGSFGVEAITWLRINDIYIKKIVDNNKEKCGQSIYGIPIDNPDSLLKDDYIIVASSWGDEIKSQLENIGYKQGNDFIVLSSCNFDNEYLCNFHGSFITWESAQNKCTGYDADNILRRVKNAILKVKSGEAIYERDSVLFEQIQYSYPILASLLYIASENNNCLNVIDFGGSLGSSYFQCYPFLKYLKKLEWSVVEQKHFVEAGNEIFKNENIKFYEDIEECCEKEKPNVILISGVLQYLENPYDFLTKLIELKIPYILFDRTPFFDKEDRITIQIVPTQIYDATYPAWFFNLNKFSLFFEEKYKKIVEFDSLEKFDLGDTKAEDKGILFKNKILNN